jgi:hypothetical protein
MDIIKTHKKGKHMNTLEKYHIHKLYKNNLYMNDSAIEPNNPIFKTLHEIDNTTRNRQQIAARYRQTTRKDKQTNAHARNRKITRRTEQKNTNETRKV